MRQCNSAVRRRAAPRLPDGVRIYAVGDVHGCADLLAGLLSQIDAHLARHPIARPMEVFLGDYIDRGPDSRRVIDLLIKRHKTRETIFLKGNHETYLLKFLKDPKVLDIWRQYGGFETLLSYRVKPPLRPKPGERRALARSFAEILPDDHLQFLSQLKTNFTCGEFLFVHAGVRPGIPLEQQSDEDLLRIRDDFLQSDDDFEKYVVHGHTPVAEPDIRPNRIGIDTGAFATGRLTCVVIEAEEMQIISQVSDGAHKASNDALAKGTIAEDDFFPAVEFPSFVSNSPAIVPLKEGVDDAPTDRSNGPSAEPSSEAAEHSIAVRPSTAKPQSEPFVNRDASQYSSPHKGPRLPKFVTPAVIALLAFGASSMLLALRLIPQHQIETNADRNRVLSEAGSNETSLGPEQTEQTSSKTQSEPRLILQQTISGSQGEALPLGARPSAKAVGMALEISGLPKGMTISAGRQLGLRGWRIVATDVADAMISPPPGFTGAVDLTIELRLADHVLADQGSLHREWRQRSMIATGPIQSATTLRATSADHEIAPPIIASNNGVRSSENSQIDHKQIAFLIGRSEALISEGDVEAARILLRRAAEARSARAALTLGATYDPIMLAILHVDGVAPDVSQARDWYEKANAFGSQEARQRLKLLASAAMETLSPPSTPSALGTAGQHPPSERTVESPPQPIESPQRPIPRPSSASSNSKPQPSTAHAPKPAGTKCRAGERQEACLH